MRALAALRMVWESAAWMAWRCWQREEAAGGRAALAVIAHVFSLHVLVW